MTDFDPLDRLVKESFARMTEGADPRRVTAFVREKIETETERNTGNMRTHHKTLTVLLAAALAVILLTTAAAAAVIAVQAVQARMRTEIEPPTEHEGEIVQSYSMEIEEHSGSQILSDEVMAALEALNPVGEDSTMTSQMIEEGSVIPFYSWQEAADFLNCGLLVNPELIPLPNENHRLHATFNNRTVQNSLSVSLFGTFAYPDTELRVHTDAFIPLNDEAWEIYNGGLYAVVHDKDDPAETDSPTSDTLISPLGDEVSLVFVPATGDFWDISAHFIHDGIIYKISVWTNDREGGESVVRRVVENMR